MLSSWQPTCDNVDDFEDSITGCKTVYMRRGQPDSFAFGRQQHPKRITFVMDISGSM